MICEKCGNKLNPNDKFCIECGNIVNQLPPVKNDKLKDLIHKLHIEYTSKIEESFFKEIENASFLAPVDIQIDGDIKDRIGENGEITLDQETQLNFMLISSEDGKNFFPAFTDEEEKAKDEVKKNAIIVKLETYIEMINKHPDDIQGIAINPFGEAIVIPKDRILK